MNLITHRSHIPNIPDKALAEFIIKRFDQIADESNSEVLPTIILVNEGDTITGPDYALVGPQGLLSDLFEEKSPYEDGFSRPYEWVSHWPELKLYEALLLINGEDGYWIIIPEAIVAANPDLEWVLTDESQGGLSEPQPL
jgi:hypothetical protein